MGAQQNGEPESDRHSPRYLVPERCGVRGKHRALSSLEISKVTPLFPPRRRIENTNLSRIGIFGIQNTNLSRHRDARDTRVRQLGRAGSPLLAPAFRAKREHLKTRSHGQVWPKSHGRDCLVCAILARQPTPCSLPGTATLETLGFDNSFVRDLPGDPLSQKDVVIAYPEP